MRRYIQLTVIALLLLGLGAWVEAVPLWALGLLDRPAQTAAGASSSLSEPALLVVFATVMAFSARQLRRRQSTQ